MKFPVKLLYCSMCVTVFLLGCSTSSSDSSTSAYDISASTITRSSATFPQSFTITSTEPSYDGTALLKSPLTEKKFATIAIKATGSSLGFAVGSYNSNGRLLYKILFQFATDITVFPDATTTSRTYNLTAGTVDISASTSAGLAPSWSRQTGVTATAAISYVPPTDTAPAGYTIDLTSITGITGITEITANASGSTL